MTLTNVFIKIVVYYKGKMNQAQATQDPESDIEQFLEQQMDDKFVSDVEQFYECILNNKLGEEDEEEFQSCETSEYYDPMTQSQSQPQSPGQSQSVKSDVTTNTGMSSTSKFLNGTNLEPINEESEESDNLTTGDNEDTDNLSVQQSVALKSYVSLQLSDYSRMLTGINQDPNALISMGK